MKMLKLFVYYVQNLQNTKFYSRKIKFVCFKKNFKTSCQGQVQKPIIYNISV